MNKTPDESASVVWNTPCLEHVDPTTLVLEGNSRTIKDFQTERPRLIASVAEHGVRTPITANPLPDGRLQVRFGFSRAMAAALAVASHPTIPVIVVEADADDAGARRVDQYIENDIREGHSTADQARLIDELALFGMTTDQIANQLSEQPDTVRAALKVRRGKTTEVVDRYPQLSLTQAAALSAHEHDPTAYDDLLTTLDEEPEQFEHRLSWWQQQAEEQAQRDALAESLRESGVAVTDGQLPPPSSLRLHRLLRSDTDNTALDADPQAHASCSGHRAYITTVPGTGAPVARYVCQDWQTHGHVDTVTTQNLSFPSTAASVGPRSEEQKADLRRVRRLNEQWRAAVPVRREQLSALVRKKTPPKAVQHYIATTVVTGPQELRRAMERDHPLTCELLGVSPEPGRSLEGRLQRCSAKDATMISLAVLLAAAEDSTSVHTWRTPSAEQKRYFQALHDWGITLCPVERMVFDPHAEPTHDTADLPELDDAEAGDDPDADADDLDAEVDDGDDLEADVEEQGEVVTDP